MYNTFSINSWFEGFIEAETGEEMAKRAHTKTVEVNASRVPELVSPEGNSLAQRRGGHFRTRQPVANIYRQVKHILRTRRCDLVRRRSNLKIKQSEWVLITKENSHGKAY